MKHFSVAQDIKIDVNKLRNAYEKIKEKLGFTTDDPNNTDFHAICINRKPGDPNSITGGNVRGLYWTYPNETGKEEQRCPKIDENEKLS